MWIESLRTSFSQSRYSVVQSLLRDFGSIKEEEYNEELVTEGLQLMFDILKSSKVSDARPPTVSAEPQGACRPSRPAQGLGFAGQEVVVGPGRLTAVSAPPQNDAVTQQLAAIFTHCYGSSPVPSIPEIRKTLPARLGEACPPHPLHSAPSPPRPWPQSPS